MSRRLPEKDVVIVGLGWTGSIMALDVSFQEVVHSVLAVNAEVAKPSDSRSTEWTLTRMPI